MVLRYLDGAQPATMLSAVGQPVPNTPHAVSVSLPSWKANVGYEEGEDWVISKMKTGYPRFFIHLTIQELQQEMLNRYGRAGEAVMLFPSLATAMGCRKFFYDKVEGLGIGLVHVYQLLPWVRGTHIAETTTFSGFTGVFFPKEYFSVAKQVWQHTGDGLSSRKAEFCLKALRDGMLQPLSPRGQHHEQVDHTATYTKGPRRYQRPGSRNGTTVPEPTTPSSPIPSTTPTTSPSHPENEDLSPAQFIEERFGRNLNAKLASQAKLAIRRRITGCLRADTDLEIALSTSDSQRATEDEDTKRQSNLSEDDVYLFPTGMSAIFNAHQILLHRSACGPTPLKSICFGFTYIDTLKILEKWGAGCLFYGRGDADDLLDLEHRLESGERYLSLFTEFPSNPLLNSADLPRLRYLADKYDFVLVVDETVGNFTNIDVLSHAHIAVSSLTKVFSGDSNVMGGSAVLNPQSPIYGELKKAYEEWYEDNYWAEDAVFMERNSRDFVSRSERINGNAMGVAKLLAGHECVKRVYYPALSASVANYEICRTTGGGYGGLLSVTFHHPKQAEVFFDALEVAKGPSLGTNFTLACPYTVLAHYGEMEWAEGWGVERGLVRLSVGLEGEGVLKGMIGRALGRVEGVVV